MKIICLALTVFALLISLSYSYQKFSPKQIVLVTVPYNSGSGPDLVARKISQVLQEKSGFTVIIENTIGASGKIGAMKVKNSNQTATQLLIASNSIAISSALDSKNPINPLQDFIPITKVGSSELVLAVNQYSDIDSLNKLISYSGKHPYELTFGSPGEQTPQYLALKQLEAAVNIKVLAVNYKDSGQAVSALVSGEIDAMFLPIQTAIQFKSKIKIIAIVSPKRSALLSDVPTFIELNFPTVDSNVWYAIFAKKETDKYQLDLIRNAIKNVLSDTNFINFLPLGISGESYSQDILIKSIKTQQDNSKQVLNAH